MEKIDSKNGIIGLVVGDAIGVPLEFCVREKSKVINKEKICESINNKTTLGNINNARR